MTGSGERRAGRRASGGRSGSSRTFAQARAAVKRQSAPASAIDCPDCGRRAPFHGDREKTVETLGGAVTCNRADYYCGLCATGSCPWDGRVGSTDHRLSPAVERLATLCGAVADSLEKGTELLKETAGIVLGESTVQRTTEASGHRIAAHLQRGRAFGGRVQEPHVA